LLGIHRWFTAAAHTADAVGFLPLGAGQHFLCTLASRRRVCCPARLAAVSSDALGSQQGSSNSVFSVTVSLRFFAALQQSGQLKGRLAKRWLALLGLEPFDSPLPRENGDCWIEIQLFPNSP